MEIDRESHGLSPSSPGVSISSAARRPIMQADALVAPDRIAGMTDASAPQDVQAPICLSRVLPAGCVTSVRTTG